MLSLIPISDANPTSRFPFVTVFLIVINVVAFFFVQPDFGESSEATVYFARHVAVPCQLQDECPNVPVQYGPDVRPIRIPDRDTLSFLEAMLFSTFLHAGFFHIAGNMLFFWVFGNNIEDFLGPIRYLIFYLLGGLAAGFAQVLTHLDGDAALIPAVGASGAIAAVMGAYLVLYPRAKVNTIVPIVFIWTIIPISAYVVLGFWFVLQFFTGEASAVAWMAHVGGFVFGALAILVLGGRPQQPRPRVADWRF